MLGCFTVVTANASDQRPNFVVIVADDQGWTGTSVQMDPNVADSKSDYYQTPNLERLAAEGMRFSNAYSAGPNCSPTRAAIQTGLSPAQNHFTSLIAESFTGNSVAYDYYYGSYLRPPHPTTLSPEVTSIADRLKAGAPEYHTAFLHKNHFGPGPLELGYDLADFHVLGYEPEGEDPAKIFSIANRTNAYMEEQVQAGKPFFVQVNQFAIHTPIVYTTESYNLFNGLPRGTRHKSPGIAAMTYDLDTSVGMVLDQIDELGIADNTYVIYVSDNGGTGAPLNNAPLSAGKGSLLEGGVRVPLIVRGPSVQANSHSSVPVTTTDLFATITDLAGVTTPLPANSESASWKSVLENGGVLPDGESLHRAFGENGELYFHYPHRGTPSSTVRDGDFKLVRLYATSPNASDTLLLFDLAANLEESLSVSSPLNVAATYPEKVQELNAKLDRWLEGVDASMALPYDTPIHLEWTAEDFGTEVGRWRSHLRIKNYRLETLKFSGQTFAPIAQDVTPHQPGLARVALSMDEPPVPGGWPLIVSDDTLDLDNSATIQMWIRPTSFDQEQLLFDSGVANKGLSLSLGDADGDGKHNDLRLRVTAEDGQVYSVTTPLDEFANPARDFVQLSAVIRDQEPRSVSLFVNGALAGEVAASASIDWDGMGPSGLGRIDKSSIGGTAGTEQPAFVGGKYTGLLSKFSVRNWAESPEDILAGYNSLLHATDRGIAFVQGDLLVPSGRPSSSESGAWESSEDLAFIIHERDDVLDSSLQIDLRAESGMYGVGAASPMADLIPAGTPITSYLLHFDPSDLSAATSATGTISFERPLLGVIFTDATLASSDPLLASVGRYATAERMIDLEGSDWLSISDDLKTLSFQFSASSTQMFNIRLITAQVSLVPATSGDYNGDGVVNLADYTVWRDSFGQSGPSLAADGNGDQKVDAADYQVWKLHFGMQAGDQGAATVAEPASLYLGCLTLLGTVGLAIRRRRVFKSV